MFATDAEILSIEADPYLQWKNWQYGPSSSAVAFFSPEDCWVIAAAHHARLFVEGLDLQGVDLLTSKPDHSMVSHPPLLHPGVNCTVAVSSVAKPKLFASL